jgi:hypothetical protein
MVTGAPCVAELVFAWDVIVSAGFTAIVTVRVTVAPAASRTTTFSE